MTYQAIIPAHGGYRKLMSYQMATIVADYTHNFIPQYIDQKSRTRDQMEQAARSGKQNIVEGSMASGTSKKTEIKLLGVSRASEPFLRQNNLQIWPKSHPETLKIRQLSYMSDKSY